MTHEVSLPLEYLHSGPPDIEPNTASVRIFASTKWCRAHTRSVAELCTGTSDVAWASEGFQWENKRGISNMGASMWPVSMTEVSMPVINGCRKQIKQQECSGL